VVLFLNGDFTKKYQAFTIYNTSQSSTMQALFAPISKKFKSLCDMIILFLSK
jgi:hypothetical protein